MEPIEPKTFTNTTAKGATEQVADIEFWGDGDLFKLLSKASSKAEGWMKSTKAMDIGHGCVVQVTTQQLNIDGTYSLAEAITYVPGVTILDLNRDGQTVARYIKPIDEAAEILAAAKDSEDEF